MATMPGHGGELQEAKAELEALFASGIFERAPNMARFLNYVCTRYFEGRQDELKEYNIAVEALGRPPDFDPDQDSIVRVEAHHLRKRLDRFYEGRGATHKMKIILPVGQYVPQFVANRPNGTEEQGADLALPEIPVAAPETGLPPPPADRGAKARWRLAVAALVLAAAAAGAWLTLRPHPSTAPQPLAVPVAHGDAIRILAGSTDGDYTDRFGHVWQADAHFAGGYITSYAGHAVRGACDARLFQSAREGDFQYDIPLAPGSYELRLYFAEMLFGEGNVGGGGEGTRIFNVDANGKRLLSGFDVISDSAGANVADERVFKDISPDKDGLLHLRFTHQVRDAFLNAIEITPGIPGRLRPIRILMADTAYVDRAGVSWDADRYYSGGQLMLRPHPVAGATDPGIYRSQRCGNVTYVIPVAEGSYSMTLRFAEGWYGTGKPVGGGTGSRRFNIFCNSAALERDFDIYKEAGGAERALERTYRGLRPNPQGKLVLQLQPVVSYACINSLEVREDAR